MGGTGSGRYPGGSGRKPKKKKKNGRGGYRVGGGRPKGSVNKKTGGKRRVPLNVTVSQETKELLRSIAESEGVSEGKAVDMLAEPYIISDEDWEECHRKPEETAPAEPECQNKAVQGSLF